MLWVCPVVALGVLASAFDFCPGPVEPSVLGTNLGAPAKDFPLSLPPASLNKFA